MPNRLNALGRTMSKLPLRSTSHTPFPQSPSTACAQERPQKTRNPGSLGGARGVLVSCLTSEVQADLSTLALPDLLLDDFALERARQRAVQLDWDLERTKRSDRLLELDLAAVDRHTLSCEGVFEILGGDGTEHLGVFASRSRALDAHGHAAQLAILVL